MRKTIKSSGKRAENSSPKSYADKFVFAELVGEITRKHIRRGFFRSVPDLVAAIEECY